MPVSLYFSLYEENYPFEPFFDHIGLFSLDYMGLPACTEQCSKKYM